MGEVHPGDRRAVFGELSGRQAFVEQCHMFMVKEQSTVPLRNDLGPYWVHVGARVPVDS